MNGGAEAIKGLIELHRRIARGFRNRENYRLRMLLIIGGSGEVPDVPRSGLAPTAAWPLNGHRFGANATVQTADRDLVRGTSVCTGYLNCLAEFGVVLKHGLGIRGSTAGLGASPGSPDDALHAAPIT